MHRNFHIEIPDKNKFIQDLNNKSFIEFDGENIWELGFDTEPHSEYEQPENFPLCCEYHSSILKQLEEWMSEFPNCCEDHKKLNHKKWFNKDNYSHIPNKIIRQLSYTENFVDKNIELENWFQEITDYINYTIESFGTPNIGGGKYYQYLVNWLKKSTSNVKEFPDWKRAQLIEFLESLGKNIDSPKTDLNLLHSTFQKWLKTFPSLPHFINLKLRLTGKIPLNVFLHKPQYNRFTGETKFKMRTKGELIELLINSTKTVLNSIDTPTLLKNKYISTQEKYQIEILNEQHNLNQNQLLVDYSKSEIKYIKIIKKWLKNEKEYMKDLQLLLKNYKTMPKQFIIEKRKVFENEYLKVFLRDKKKIEKLQNFISSLQSVKNVNITDNNEKDLTVYPAKTYSADETENELNVALEGYFGSGEIDPIFKDDIIQLSDESYDSIIDLIFNYGQNLEKFKDLYDKFDEEGFRNFFLPHLNTISKNHTATGETFNKIGKSDILIQDNEGKNVFIAECKLWKGEGELSKAVNQLLERYVNWRDEKTAIIVFNKDMKKFNELMIKAVDKIQEHPLFDSYLGQRNESCFSFIFKHPDDETRKIRLELILFNCV